MATRKTTSVKGEIVDFDLLETKQKIEQWLLEKQPVLKAK